MYEQNQHVTEIYVAMATNMSNLSHKSTKFYLIYSVYNAMLFLQFRKKKKYHLRKNCVAMKIYKTISFIEIVCGF